jgi:hypothetical protein
MSSAPRARRRLHIDRLELDLRGVAPATAEAAARALGPALAQALVPLDGNVAPAERIDAGRIASPASPSASDLAAGIAQRIARSVRGRRP